MTERHIALGLLAAADLNSSVDRADRPVRLLLETSATILAGLCANAAMAPFSEKDQEDLPKLAVHLACNLVGEVLK